MNQKTIQSLSIAFFVVLLIWGGYSLLYYLGVPVHISVLLNDAAREMVNASCGLDSFVCRGWQALFPFIIRTIGRAGPFLWYTVICGLLYAIYLGWQGLRSGSFALRWHLRPWHVFLLFLGSVWLLFSTLSSQEIDGVSIRRFVEPLPQVYQNVGPEGIAELQKNYERMQERNCLRQQGEFGNGAKVFMMTTPCVQSFFFTRVIPPLLFVLLFLFELVVLGRFLLHALRLRRTSLLSETMMSVGLGACGWMLILWTVAVLGILTMPIGWIAFVLLPLALYRHSLYWIRIFLFHEWEMERDWYDILILLGWLLLSYLALNFLFVVRPFPIGWDDLGSYLNRPRLMVSYGSFVFSMAPFQWEYLTSLGFLLFGYSSALGATTSMMVNWTAGLLAVFVIIAFTQMFVGKGRGLVAALMYYMLPVVGHFSFADMKIDNAVFLIGGLSIFALFQFLFQKTEDGWVTPKDAAWKPEWSWLIAVGIFSGFGLGMKATTVMVTMAVGAMMLGGILHWTALLGSVFFIFIVYVLQGVLDISKIITRVYGDGVTVSKYVFLAVCAIFGFGFIGFALYKRKEHAVNALKSVALFVGVFLASISPWLLHNTILHGDGVEHLQMGAPNSFTPVIDLSGKGEYKEGVLVRRLPEELAVDTTTEACTPTGSKEELDRYWGFGSGWKHYLTLPWRSTMNLDSAGYYVTTTFVLVLVPLLLLLPFFWMKSGSWVRLLFAGTVLMLVQWVFLANGIPWYGIGTFFGLVIGLEVLVAKAPDSLSRWVLGIFFTLAIFSMLSHRFWQFEQQRNLLEYPFGKVSAAALRERTIPHYDDISEIAVERNATLPDRPYLYRIGTFIPYFIPRNLEIIGAADHQLDLFNCLYQERDAKLTLERLKALGFSSIIFDTNTATIERDPNGSLHQKVNALVGFLNTTELGLQMIVNDVSAGVAYVLIP